MGYEMEIEVDGVKKIVKLRRLTYGEYMDILKSALKVEMVGEITKSNLDVVKFRHDIVLACIENKNEIDVDKLDVKTALEVEAKVFELNGMGKFFQ
jgi:hypothetical protein